MEPQQKRADDPRETFIIFIITDSDLQTVNGITTSQLKTPTDTSLLSSLHDELQALCKSNAGGRMFGKALKAEHLC